MKGYYSMSMVVTRATGIPYRQNDLVMDAVNGRVLIRRHAVERLGLGTKDFMLLRRPTDGRYVIELRRDERGLLGQHLSWTGKRTMQFNARGMVRQWCMGHGVRELRMRIKAAAEVSQGVRELELERVDDLCEMYHWDSRKKEELRVRSDGVDGVDGVDGLTFKH